jgi:hypothetical protein
MLVLSNFSRPEDFHEIAWLRAIEVIEVLSKLQLVKKAGGAGSVSVPSAPDAFPIVLISNNQSLQRGIVEVQLTARAQGFDRSDEDQIGRARAETRRGLGRQNEKFTGLEMRRRLKTDLCKVRDGVATALRHLPDLLKNQAVIVASKRRRRCEPKNRKTNPSHHSLHGGISNHQKPIWQ